MAKFNWRKIVATIVLCTYSLQVTTAVAMSSMPTTTQSVETYSPPNDPSNSTMGMQNFSLDSSAFGLVGPLSVGYDYDTLLGSIFNAQYVQKITNSFALGAIGEYGSNQYRLNGTLGYQLYSEGQAKFSAEYLSQVLPFSFDSGDINQRVDQSAYGLRFQHDLHNPAFKNINFGGYWAKAPNTALSSITYTGSDGLEYVNERNLAGATSQGLDIGTDITLSPTTLVNATFNYDSVNYDTQYTSDSSYNAAGVGTTLKINQIVNDRLQVSADLEARKIYNTYGANLDYAPAFAKNIGLKMGLFAQHLISHNQTPDSNTYGIQFTFLGDDGGQSPHYQSNDTQKTSDIVEWVKDPAIYMDRVLVVSEQQTTLSAPKLLSVEPSSGPFTGRNLVRIKGGNLVEGTRVLFGGQPAEIISLDSHNQLTVVVPPPLSTTRLGDEMTQVDVTVVNPDSQTVVADDAYTYTSASTAPAVQSISPSTGPASGGQSITITGTNFGTTETTSVQFINTATGTSVPATQVSVAQNIQTGVYTITATTPAGTVGTANVAVTVSDVGTAISPTPYTYTSTPHIDAISPTSGPTAGGQTVTITGYNLQDVYYVNFYTTSNHFAPNIVINADGTQLTCTSPSTGTSTLTAVANIIVGTPSATSNTLSNAYTFEGPPTITQVSPASGSTSGGSTVTLTGTNFVNGATTVTFGGVPATNINVINSTQLTANTPASATAGSVTVAVTTSGGTASSANAYTYNSSAPIINSISPTSGLAGTAVTLNGSNLQGATQVTFGNNPVTTGISYNTGGTQAYVTAPTGSGVVSVSITTPSGSYTLPNAYSYQTIPNATSISPSSGPVAGGQSVTIGGSNLGTTGTTSVKFGTLPATNVTVNSNSTQITATTPAGVTGSVNVSVTTLSGTSTNTLTYTYTLIPTLTSVSPETGSTSGGTTVTLTGTNFISGSTVKFGTNLATNVTITDSSHITCKTPAGSGTVNVTVTTSGGSATLTNAFTYGASPTISSLSPTSGKTAGNETVIITGSNFTGATAVNFGSAAASFVINSSSQITATTPTNSAGNVSVTVTTPFGVSPGSTFTYVAPPTMTSFTPTTGSSTGGTSVTINGANYTNVTAVSFGSIPATSFTVNSSSKITAVAPAQAAGSNTTITVTTQYGTVTSTSAFVYGTAPTLTTLSPTSGSTSGGTTVVLSGTSLASTQSVTFAGSTAGNLTILSDTAVQVTTPAHSAGLVSVVLTTAYGSSTLANIYTYVVPPTLTQVSPSSGSTGTSVTLYGGNLNSVTGVTFGGVNATSFSQNTDGTITAITPAPVQPASTVTVAVQSPYGNSQLNNAYTYIG